MTSPNLLPCPFCGGKAYMTNVYRDHAVEACVECHGCGANSGPFVYMDRARKAWNTRAPVAGRDEAGESDA
jgi:Lar family restriction alleviation protein